MHRVGVIPFDVENGAIAMLFVTSQTRGRWILPKGMPKKGETPPQTGMREGFEEAGVTGIVLEDFPMTVPITKQGSDGTDAVPVTYYPLLVTKQADDWQEADSRERHWTLLSDASKVAYREDYLDLIRQFQALSPWIIEAAAENRS